MFWKKTIKKLYWENFTVNKNYEMLKKRQDNLENKLRTLTEKIEKFCEEYQENFKKLANAHNILTKIVIKKEQTKTKGK